MRCLSSFLCAVLCLVGCAHAPQPLGSMDPVPPAVAAVLQAQQLPTESLAWVARPLDAAGPEMGWQSGRVVVPASTMKVLTAAVALDRLGPNWRGRTEVLAQGQLVDGVLTGPLVLRGGADAALDWGALHQLLREAREAGVRDLRGGVLIDRTRYTPAREDVGLAPFDEAPEFPYNAIPDALLLNGGLLTLALSSDTQLAQARWSPAWPGLQVDAGALTLVDRPCNEWEKGWQPPQVQASAAGVTVTLAGTFPRQCQVRQALSLVDRSALAAQAVRQQWQELGGTLSGEVLEGPSPEDARPLAVHVAPPLAEWLRGAMKRSDNALTRLLFLELGRTHPRHAELGSTRNAADARVRDWLQAQGIAPDGLVLDNGSGLSRSERLTPTLLAAVLAVAARAPYAPEFEAGLPLAGVDGTLSRRFKEGAAQGRARLKTGTLRDAVGLAGYLVDAAGRRWAVAAFVNHPQAAAKGRPVLDALLNQLATHLGAPSPTR